MQIRNISKTPYLMKGMKGSVKLMPGHQAEVPDTVAKAHLTLYPHDFAPAAVQAKAIEPTAEEIKKAQAALSNPPSAQAKVAADGGVK